MTRKHGTRSAGRSLSARSLEVLVTKRNESRAEQAAAQSRAATRTERYTTLTLTLSLSTLRSEMLWTLTLVVALALLQPPVASANNRLADLMENMAELSKCVEAKPRYHVKTGKQCIHRFCSKFKQCTNKKWSECLRLCGTNMQCVLSCATSASKEQCGQDDVPCKVSALNETFGCFCDTFTASHAVGKSGSPLALAAVAVWVLTATVW
ncbi:uncharacterized protein LOC113210581 [Frankliniella occidentalis]|uniref:Uncharacterized protein LOC113210581 n=1 Tax=Frankliniella occidentalis TaxID=133901 RepID=A0A6J1T155_FRAOC|nr:uncharacterized protein LOC113210581 [Frankliniella occidentalis]